MAITLCNLPSKQCHQSLPEKKINKWVGHLAPFQVENWRCINIKAIQRCRQHHTLATIKISHIISSMLVIVHFMLYSRIQTLFPSPIVLNPRICCVHLIPSQLDQYSLDRQHCHKQYTLPITPYHLNYNMFTKASGLVPSLC